MSVLAALVFLFAAVVIVELLKPSSKNKRNSREPASRARRHDVSTWPARQKQFELPYLARTLMTPTEKRFFKAISAIGANNGFLVAPQVAMSALVDIPKKYNENQYAHINRAGFSQKRLDYVLLDVESLNPVLVIELDDPSHDGRENEDAPREKMLKVTGYPLLRIDVRDQLTRGQIAGLIAATREKTS
jgi:hypothetical protein